MKTITTQKGEKIDEELQKSLKDIIGSCEKEDGNIRNSQVRTWKKSEEFWSGVQFLFWSAQDNSWRSPADFNWGDEDWEDVEEQFGSFSDKVVDIFRGHGEAIISALAAQVPSLRFLPDDADDTDDLVTARTYSKISDLVQRHNKAKLIFLRALFYLAIHGLVASYRYKDSDFEYGSYKVPVYDETEVSTDSFTCPLCGYSSNEDWTGQPCAQCSNITDSPEKQTTIQKVPTLQKEEEYPKTRAKIDVFGPLHFKIPYYARNQKEVTYFILYGDQGKDVVKETYPDNIDDIDSEHLDTLDRFARSIYSAEYDEEAQKNHLVTVKKVWLRPATFYRENDEKKREKLLKKFPTGARVILVGKKNIFISAEEEALDERWEIGQAGLSTYIHSDAILRPLIEIQEMRNQLVNLIMETINHGIPSDFADPNTINFDTYGRFEAVPGFIYKAKPARPGEPLGASFYTSSRASLSKEVSLFLSQLDKDAQFCVGSFPSIYGGPSEGKSRTFSEYAASRQMALQRLSIVWTFVTDWWVRTISGCVKMYKECVIEDERYTKFEDGNYINVWIKQSEMKGKIGGVESEASETFPVSLTQMKDLFLKLIELNNEYVNSVLYNPVNSKLIQDTLGLTDLKIPGEDQRVKQAGEINDLLKEGPLSPVQSSVPIEKDVDDNQVHIAMLTNFMVGQIGLEQKRTNPNGYANLQAHLMEHNMDLLQKTMGQNLTPSGQPPQSVQGPEEE